MKFSIFLLSSSFILASMGMQPLYAQTPNLGDIVVRFCNDVTDTNTSDNKSLSLTPTAGTPESICMIVSNNGNADATVKLSFVDGTVTDDTEQKKACAPDGTKTRFGQYVTIDNTTLMLKAGESVTTTATLTFPDGYAGPVLGCVTSQLTTTEPTTVGMFDIQTRKANFIEVVVDGAITSSLEIVDHEVAGVTNLTDSKKVSVYKDSTTATTYVTNVQLKNTGTVGQDARVDVTLTDMLGKQYTSSQNTFVPAGESRDVRQSIANIPFYQGSFTVQAIVTHTPKVEFETAALNSEDTSPKTLTETTSFIAVPRVLVGGAISVILLLIFLARRKKRTPATSAPSSQQQQQ